MEAQQVICLRTVKLARGGKKAHTEAHRMVAEKVAYSICSSDRLYSDCRTSGTVADVVEIWMTLSPAFSGYRVMRQRQAFADPS
jgi:hypothetical protein